MTFPQPKSLLPGVLKRFIAEYYKEKNLTRKNTMSNSTSDSCNHKTQYNIHIIGDRHIDYFYDENEDNEELLATCDGGVAFVEEVFRAKEKISLKDFEIPQKIEIKSYITENVDNPYNLGHCYNAKRKIIQIDNKVRYIDTLNTEYLKSKNNIFYSLDADSLDLIDKTADNFFVIEHIGNHHTDSKHKYTSMLNKKETFEKIINTLYDSIKDNHEKCGKAIRKIPQFFWIIHRDIPFFLDHRKKEFYDLNLEAEATQNSENGDQKPTNNISLKEKIRKIKTRSAIFIIENTLRREGVNISRYISWERSSQDYIKAFYSNRIMDSIRDFSHIIVRFGLSGAIYSAGTFEESIEASKETSKLPAYEPERRIVHRLFFDPTARKNGIYRDPDIEGDVIGYQCLFAACSVFSILQYKTKFTSDVDFIQVIGAVGIGIKKSIRSSQILFDEGFGKGTHKYLKLDYFTETEKTIYTILSNKENTERYSPHSIANERIPIDIPNWSLLKQSAEYHLFDVAEAIVYEGVEESLNKTSKYLFTAGIKRPIWAPIVKFGNLTVVDRREIEGYNSVHSLMEKTIKGNRSRPLSIAVFGPPGSGKSFAIKELISSSIPLDLRNNNFEKAIQFETINMTEIDTYSTFEARITEIKRNYNKSYSTHPALSSKPPQRRKLVIFFDEFDCTFNGEELGWLKRFLPIMEDWRYNDADSEDNNQIGSAIFVFAGGTSYNYSDFSREDGSITEQQKADFITKKGPDFVSRLRGHINILGPNRVDDNDDGHVIRRAIFLRSILDEQSTSKKNQEKIDPAVVKAMLKVSSFKHGVRSMRAIITMCSTLGGGNGKIVGSTLPTLPQLNMHVNGKEFLDMVIEYGMR